MLIRKWTALILAAVMILVSAAAVAEEPDDGFFDEPALYTGPEYDYDHLVVGHTTALSGGFSNRIWGSNTSDLDVSALINGYNLVTWEYEQGCFKPDPSVVTNADNLQVWDDAEGNRTYLLTLDYDDLKYSDGTPITAYDYAFNILLHVAPQAAELNGDTDWFPYILGMKEYKSGEAATLAGLHVANKNMISITVSHEYRPFFYELGYLWCYPSPIHIIAPGCKITDQGDGCFVEGDFTAELLNKTMLDPDTGYRSHPSAVSGPYMLTSFDGVTAEFEINPYFKGNKEGIKPSIKNLTYTLADNATAIQDLSEGKFGLINKALNVNTVNEGIALVGTGNFAMSNYARIGQSQISFCCEKKTVSDPAVRQAISLCLDKEALVSDYTGYYGLAVDGYYGIGQWMYQVVTGAINPPVQEGIADSSETSTTETVTTTTTTTTTTVSASEMVTTSTDTVYQENVAAWDQLTLDNVPVYRYDPEDTETVPKLLNDNGWNLNTDGEPFVPGEDEVRCKEIDGELIALDLKMIYPEGNTIADSFDATFLSNLAAQGIKVTLEPVELNHLRELYHRDVERDCDMIYIASNFDEVFDPSPAFDPADAMIGKTNYSAINDQELFDRVIDMNKTEPGDAFGYVSKWIRFQERYQEVVPAIPVYGNAYFDFFTACLQNYAVNQNVTWTEAIVPAYMSDPMMEESTEDDFDDDGEFTTFD